MNTEDSYVKIMSELIRKGNNSLTNYNLSIQTFSPILLSAE